MSNGVQHEAWPGFAKLGSMLDPEYFDTTTSDDSYYNAHPKIEFLLLDIGIGCFIGLAGAISIIRRRHFAKPRQQAWSAVPPIPPMSPISPIPAVPPMPPQPPVTGDSMSSNSATVSSPKSKTIFRTILDWF